MKKYLGYFALFAVLITMAGCASSNTRTGAEIGAVGGSGGPHVYGSVRLGTSIGF